MSWTVPSGCYYAYYAGYTNFYYYGAGQSVPTEYAPNNSAVLGYERILIDFTNGYIYTGINYSKGLTINIASNNTFTITSGIGQQGYYTTNIIASEYALDAYHITLTGSTFSFGNGSGMLNKSSFLSSGSYYVMKDSFRGRTDITSVTIPTGIDFFSSTFYGCTNLQIASGTIGNIGYATGMFMYCSSLTTPPTFQGSIVSLPATVASASSIGKFKTNYRGCTALTTAPLIPNGVTHISNCFNGCISLTSAPVIPSSVTDMDNCFDGCTALTNAPTIPSSVTNMNSCFYGCTSLTTPPDMSNATSVTSMSSCFYGCTSLTTAPSIPTSVTYMGSCFYGCASLTTPPDMSNVTSVTYMGNCFFNCTSLTTAPSIPSGVTDMSSCFRNCTSLTTAPSISSSVTDMTNCFYGCTSLTTAPTIPSGVTNMSYCFVGCVALATAPDMSNATSITNMKYCFQNCTALITAPDIPSSVTDMSYCFVGCVALATAPEIPSSVTNMYYCFYGCTSLTTPPDMSNATSVTTMSYCFYGCTSLTTAPTIPSSVIYMEYSFYGCASLTTAPEIPSSVTDMMYCFYGCTALTGNITVNNTPTSRTGIFGNTTQPIFIINGGSAGTVWKDTIVPAYSNVHYEADDVNSPSISMTVTRVDSNNSEVQTETGTYAYINIQLIPSNTYIPTGWSASIGTKTLTVDSLSETLGSPTLIDGVYVFKHWVSLDTSQHTFTAQISNDIKNENNVTKTSKVSNSVTRILSKSYKLVDYYHESDPNDDYYNTEGVAFGKYADRANLFDVAMPAIFRDLTTCQDMTTGSGGEIEDFISELDISGAGLNTTQADWVVEQGTNGIWTYRKWQSGIAECWGTKVSNYAITSSYGSAYYTSDSTSLPSDLFVSITSAIATRGPSSNNAGGLIFPSLHTATTTTLTWYVTNLVSGTINNVGISFYIKGRWE